MAEATVLKAKERTERGTRAVTRLRKHGRLPAVVYGHQQTPVSLTISDEDIRSVIRHGIRVVDLELEGKTEKCLIREVQWDAIGKDVLHVDFTRVSADERIRITVPLQIRGTAPGVTAGGILQQSLHTLEIECLALSVPDVIRVNVGELQIEQALHVREITLPPGVKALGDPEAVVVQVIKPVEEAAAPAEVAEGPAEPEVIGRKAAEEKEGEGE
jgi:large subunit ribosomal protein L25